MSIESLLPSFRLRIFHGQFRKDHLSISMAVALRWFIDHNLQFYHLASKIFRKRLNKKKSRICGIV